MVSTGELTPQMPGCLVRRSLRTRQRDTSPLPRLHSESGPGTDPTAKGNRQTQTARPSRVSRGRERKCCRKAHCLTCSPGLLVALPS